MQYRDRVTGAIEVLWNSRDGVTPLMIQSLDGNEAEHVNWRADTCVPDFVPTPGMRIFVDASPKHAHIREAARDQVEHYWDHGQYPISALWPDKQAAVEFFIGEWTKPGTPTVIQAKTMTPTADQSALILTNHLKKQERFSFWRFGDGFLELQMGKLGKTCDGEEYTPQLANDLLSCWAATLSASHLRLKKCYLGDWQMASFAGPSDASRYSEEWSALIGHGYPQFLHPEALLFMRESQPLADFYRAVRADRRRKLYMGPADNEAAAHWLGAEFLPTPMRNLHASVERYGRCLKSHPPADIVLFGAGLAGMIPAVRCWHKYPDRTYIHLGSALDPMFRGKSRNQQLTKEQCWRMFE